MILLSNPGINFTVLTIVFVLEMPYHLYYVGIPILRLPDPSGLMAVQISILKTLIWYNLVLLGADQVDFLLFNTF